MRQNRHTGDEAPGQGIGRGTNQGGMREANERLLLTVLRRNAPMAKADIARATGLSAQTVARLIGALEDEGLIARGTPKKGRIGQPSTPLSLDPLGALFLGMKVGRRSVEMVVIDFVGRVLDREQHLYDYPDFAVVRDFANAAAAQLRARLPDGLQDRVGGLGIAMPFHLWNWAQHIGVDAALMADWERRDLQAEVAGALDIPVFLQNDATSACSAEMVFGAAPMPANALCFFLAFFIGGGLVINNTLYSGSTGNAAGLGPLQVPDRDGQVRPLIDLASLSVLEKSLVEQGHDARQMWVDPEAWTFPAPIVEAWLGQCAVAMARAICSVQTLLDLEAILIDGWMPRDVVADLTARVRGELAGLDLTGLERPEIKAGTIGKDARAIGAASLPLGHRFLMV
ncbi:ROK family transcriptional regulator [Gymnodinialimonas sp. 2305UL16-5]|uniref:ROK family transcriptional regulator n=1 Tax=Gymnodinialimonas mytili TaxID=3126503 RepID=UPI00309FDB29